MTFAPCNDGIGRAPTLGALQRHGNDGTVAVEAFEYVPDGPRGAARAIGYLCGIEEALRV